MGLTARRKDGAFGLGESGLCAERRNEWRSEGQISEEGRQRGQRGVGHLTGG